MKQALTNILCLFLCWDLSIGFASTTTSTSEVKVTCGDPSNLATSNPDYILTLSQRLKELGAKTVNCGSCYRSPDDQRRACQKICGKDSCPNLCAAPGRSQHQKKFIATCDLSGMPAGSCYKLKKLCDDKYGGKCGIGGYPGGGYHFGTGDSRFSAWNKCAGLPRKPGDYTPPPGAKASPEADPKSPHYGLPPEDPSEGEPSGSELDAQELNKNHNLLIFAAMALVGAGAAALYFKSKGK